MKKVSDASGAKYTSESDRSISGAPGPHVPTKPVFTPSRSGGIAPNRTTTVPLRGLSDRTSSDDGWGPDAPPVTRTQLEKVQPAYKPTKVNMHELKSEKQPTGGNVSRVSDNSSGVVKGGYQPVGKVDIAAIRRQARDSGHLQDDRPEPVKGAYEPVGKVDIAAIRSQAQHPSQRPPSSPSPDNKLTTPPNAPIATTKGPTEQNSERLTSLPKPKISNKFGTTPAFTGTKPPLPNDSGPKPIPSAVHGASRTFADQGGKTPAQIWAEKKARERGEDFSYGSLSYGEGTKNEEWKSSPDQPSESVKPTHTGKSIGSRTPHDVAVNREQSIEAETPAFSQQPITTWQDHRPVEPVEEDPSRTSDASLSVHLPEQLPEPVEEHEHNPEHHEFVPGPPERESPPSSPPAREASPIRVAMPVGRGGAESQPEQGASSFVSQSDEIPQVITAENASQNDSHGAVHERSQPVPDNHNAKASIRAIAQYDYDKAEDNEIQLLEGEYVVDIDMVDRDWWLGSNVRGERGLFPSNYVEIVEHDQQSQNPPNTQDADGTAESVPPAESATTLPTAASTTASPSATALYDYEAAEDNELSFPEGAQITSIVSVILSRIRTLGLNSSKALAFNQL